MAASQIATCREYGNKTTLKLKILKIASIHRTFVNEHAQCEHVEQDGKWQIEEEQQFQGK